MRILARYLAIEVLVSLLAVGFVLGLVIIGSTFVRLLGLSASGALPVELLASLVAVESLKAMMLLMPVALFLAVMLTFGRFYRDSEMTAIQAAGVSPLRLYGGLMLLGLPMALLSLYLMLMAYPWASQQSVVIQHEGQQRMDFAGVESGRFMGLDGGRVVAFVANLSGQGKRLEDIFVHAVDNGVPVVLSAHSGTLQIERDKGLRVLSLINGTRYDGHAGSANYKILQFDRYQAVMPLAAIHRSGTLRRIAMPTLTLWRHGGAADLAELEWRLAIPISTLILILLAVPMSHVRPRQGRYGQLVFGMLIYVVYANLILIAKAWMEKGIVPVWIGMWWPHLVILALASLLWWRRAGWRWPVTIRRRVA
ncbi:LPS export ABC transporter permease LptF [Acidihalobacter yilgarnensis]|uniref:Lipopolysaccharide export system permease protein LptF n=1 Tax=Acidihalobacter yilgarnensis TaxID=2819280 RepID=A0A1D8IPJ7_9GAMM|nr:LPS export ABC transporter permease LptF [Acidihalobacter yilgarnensis]AOU98381.1 LPS export ABC transporter permease LptF [Acidihalobacter yilgarnensis]